MATLTASFDIGIAITTLISAGIGAYLGAYLKKKGENLATHEDIGRLVDQVRAVTTVTKEIEAKIFDEAWDRQKRWELKRDVLFEAAKGLAEIDDSLLSLKTVFHLEQQQGGVNWLEAKVERQKRWIKAAAVFDETRVLIGIVCRAETIAAFEKFGLLASEIAAKLNTDPNAYTISQNRPYEESFCSEGSHSEGTSN
jgi:hypothetical protein